MADSPYLALSTPWLHALIRHKSVCMNTLSLHLNTLSHHTLSLIAARLHTPLKLSRLISDTPMALLGHILSFLNHRTFIAIRTLNRRLHAASLVDSLPADARGTTFSSPMSLRDKKRMLNVMCLSSTHNTTCPVDELSIHGRARSLTISTAKLQALIACSQDKLHAHSNQGGEPLESFSLPSVTDMKIVTGPDPASVRLANFFSNGFFPNVSKLTLPGLIVLGYMSQFRRANLRELELSINSRSLIDLKRDIEQYFPGLGTLSITLDHNQPCMGLLADIKVAALKVRLDCPWFLPNFMDDVAWTLTDRPVDASKFRTIEILNSFGTISFKGPVGVSNVVNLTIAKVQWLPLLQRKLTALGHLCMQVRMPHGAIQNDTIRKLRGLTLSTFPQYDAWGIALQFEALEALTICITSYSDDGVMLAPWRYSKPFSCTPKKLTTLRELVVVGEPKRIMPEFVRGAWDELLFADQLKRVQVIAGDRFLVQLFRDVEWHESCMTMLDLFSRRITLPARGKFK